MPDAVTPALTKGEWAKGLAWPDLANRLTWAGQEAGDFFYEPSRHALAALCLYQQPFGFTRADVVELRKQGEDWADSLAARIAALLPPEEDAP